MHSLFARKPTPLCAPSSARVSTLQAQLDSLVHRTFTQAVERQLCALSAAELADWLDQTDDAVLDMLAALYLRACQLQSCRPQALLQCVRWLDAQRLARLARSFGYAQVHLALLQASPEKESAYMRAARPEFRGPQCLSGPSLRPVQATQAIQAIKAIKAIKVVGRAPGPLTGRPLVASPVPPVRAAPGALSVLR